MDLVIMDEMKNATVQFGFLGKNERAGWI